MKDAVNRYLKCVAGSFFLFGPRGTGKSTWLKMVYPKAIVVDLLKSDVYRQLQAKPERLAELVRGNPSAKVFVVDEVQKVPALLEVVHSLIEEHEDRAFVLTGSSARKLKRESADLLAGRAAKLTMHPFVAQELGDAFDLEKALAFGLLPVVHGARNPEAALSAYIDLYLREEIQQEGLVRNLGPFTRFLEAVTFSHGSQLVSSDISRDCGVGRTTVDSYLKILYDLLIAEVLPVFSKRAKRALVSHGKFYFFDVGVYRALRPKGPLDRPSEIDGAALEGLVYQHLRAWLDYAGCRDGLYFWRTVGGLEVDFIVYTPTSFLAIEVKNAARVDRSDFKGLKAFREDFPEARTMMLYRGEMQYEEEGVLVVPVGEFLKREMRYEI